ncbi:MAG: tetratricopeptide repeat protein [Planctomycetota bacterium]
MSTDVSQSIDAAQRALSAGDIARAERTLDALLTLAPDDPRGRLLRAMCALVRGDIARAEPHAERAVALDQTSAQAWSTLGTVRLAQERHADAREAGLRATALNPRSPEAWVGLGRALRGLGEDRRAADAFRSAIAIAPRRVDAVAALADALLHDADAAGAVDLLAKACKLSPADATLASLLAMTMQYDERQTPERIEAAHKAFGSIVERAVTTGTVNIADPDPDRPLRIGVLSADLRRHSVAFFARSFIERLGDRGMPIVCFSDAARDDPMTERLRGAASGWHDVRGESDDAVAQLIRRERIDVLIDLAGHTAGNRLPLLARRPAPLSITMIGYPATTGLTRIDARVVDSHTDPFDPPTSTGECLVRLDPCFLCYSPDEADTANEAAAPGGAIDGPFTFCSFNDQKKYTPGLLRAWATILERSPGARLLVKARTFDAEARRHRFVSRLESMGAPAGSVEVLGPLADAAEHLRLYTRAHLALDTFPYHGTTTTCEAALMGVPTLTIAGKTHASRVGVSLNHALGRESLVVDSYDAYIATGVRIARSPEELATLRTGLRDRLLRGPLGDADAYAERLACVIRRLWRERVARAQGS